MPNRRAANDIDIIGGVWKKLRTPRASPTTRSIKRLGYNANLGCLPGQDDPTLQSIIGMGTPATDRGEAPGDRSAPSQDRIPPEAVDFQRLFC